MTGPAIVKDSVDMLGRDEAPHWRGAYIVMAETRAALATACRRAGFSM